MTEKPNSHRPLVCILAYDGLCTFEFGICVEVFGLPRPELTVPWYRYEVVAVEPGPLRAHGGFTLQVDGGLDRLDDADLILVPGWRGIDEPVPAVLCDALRRANRRGCRIATVCSGAFVPAAAGLLTGRSATTHWRYEAALRSIDPDIEVNPDVLYVDAGDIVTSAGSAAGLDMCLHLVRQDYGAEVANSVARRLVLPAHRDGGQAQFVPRPVAPPRGGDIAPLMDRILEQIDETWSLERMAEGAGLSPRTLLRRFKDATGFSPQTWLTRQRVAYCKELLETTELNIQGIAERSGFITPETLRHHFRQIVGVAPMAYRASFSR